MQARQKIDLLAATWLTDTPNFSGLKVANASRFTRTACKTRDARESIGHHAGDLVLKEVAGNLQKFSRDGDLVARFGGEEFMLLLPCADYAEAERCAERIRQGVERHSVHISDEMSIQVTVSRGVAQVKSAAESLEEAANRADKALYKAKSGGRNRVCCAT